MTRPGMSGWTGPALVAGPLLVVLGVCAVFAGQSVQALAGSTDTEQLTGAVLLSQRLNGALDDEIGATLAWSRSRTPGPARDQVKAARAATDQAFADLEGAPAPSGGAWPLAVANALGDLADVMGRLPYIRTGADDDNPPMVITSGYANESQTAARLTKALARQLSTVARDIDTIGSAFTLTALANAFEASSEESVRLTTALQERRLSDNSGITLQELKVVQDTALEEADQHATPQQRERIASIRSDDDRLNDFRDSALQSARDGDDVSSLSPGARSSITARAATRAATFWVVSHARVVRIGELMTQVATAARDRTAQADAGDRTRATVFGLIGAAILLTVTVLTSVTSRRRARPDSRPGDWTADPG